MPVRSAVILVVAVCSIPSASLAQTLVDFQQKHLRAVAHDYGDPKMNEFARSVAEAMRVPYFVEKGLNRTKVWFSPNDEEQAQEIQGRLSQFAFVTKACGKPDLVTPTTPAGTVKTCQ
jgi:hypothetical protein